VFFFCDKRREIFLLVSFFFVNCVLNGAIGFDNDQKRFFTACVENNKEVIEEIIGLYSKDYQALQSLFCMHDEDTETPLHLVAVRGFLDIVRLFLKHSASTWLRNKYQCTPLHLAIMNGSLEIVHLLHMNDADLSACDSDQGTPLHWAVAHEHLPIVAYLLKQKVMVNVVDRFLKTPLDSALALKNMAIICLLIEYGAPLTEEIKQNEFLYQKIREHFILRGRQVLQGNFYLPINYKRSSEKPL
jgi:ankyrin repeat protein